MHIAHVGAVSQSANNKRGVRKRTHAIQYGSMRNVASSHFAVGTGIGVLPDKAHLLGDQNLEMLMLDGLVLT